MHDVSIDAQRRWRVDEVGYASAAQTSLPPERSTLSFDDADSDPAGELLRRWREERVATSSTNGNGAASAVNGFVGDSLRQGSRPEVGSVSGGAGSIARQATTPVGRHAAVDGESPAVGPLGGRGPGKPIGDVENLVPASWREHSTSDSDSWTPRQRGPAVSPDEVADTARPSAAPESSSADPATAIPARDLAIEARNLRKQFGDTVAVSDVSFEVASGSIVALLGPNGAGKTTTVNMLCTLLKPDGGRAQVAGHDVSSDPAAVRRSIMLTGQFAALDESLSGRENLILFGRLLGLSKSAAKQRANELLEMFSLSDAAKKRVGQYSGGMRRRIDIACGLVGSPKVVFLDEPTTGLDPRSRSDVWTLVEQLRDNGVSVLLTTQYLEEADMLADRIVVIDKGTVIADGTADQLKAAIGESYCEVTPARATDVDRLRVALRDLMDADASTESSMVSIPAPDGPQTLVEVLRRAEAADIALSDVAMRRPSLDEVFLVLTDPDRDHPSGDSAVQQR
ncbi:ATP-binding cassette domain-containing protein [Gordonia otitidis]|uniref:ATP-binding cassette domain-containing protein n=1 Tax=Gordonia otitidis TaxID=249058 RepID=UPI001D140838|nr:ATP-binding cassette domain-containing protein [Gordonia otitidis]UEA58091.1 ATP-binding cassette domain-containing protein [Gordonia otitidis]